MIPRDILYCLTCAGLLAAVLAPGGCATYRAKPLEDRAVGRSLEPPQWEELSVAASRIHHPILAPVELDGRKGVSPDEAAVLAVILNPNLRAIRDQRALASAQLIEAGILPNPQVGYTSDFITGGNTAGAVNAYGFTANWDATSVLQRGAKVKSAKLSSQSVELDVAWQEWQVAQAAKLGVYKVMAAREELATAKEVDERLRENAALLKKAADTHQKTVLDQAAADAASQDAHGTVLELERELSTDLLALKHTIGLPPDSPLKLRPGLALPSRLHLPAQSNLADDLQERRLDLLALKLGYQSQEETLRAAIIAQFPKINVGFQKASDNTSVHTTGFGVTIDLPLFDRNQGNIATETATRQKLLDEYTGRVFDARSDIATACSDIEAITRQIADAEEALPVLQRLVATYETAIGQGNTDILSYYKARNDVSQKQIDILKLKEQLIETQIALELAAGRFIPTGESK